MIRLPSNDNDRASAAFPGGRRDREPDERLVAEELVFYAPPNVVYDFVANLDNHAMFGTEAIRLVSLEGPQGARVGGKLEMNSPWGKRTARLSIVQNAPPRLLKGRAKAGSKTVVDLVWTFDPHPQGTLVRLAVVAVRMGMADTIAWRTGAQGWLRKQLAACLVAVEGAGRGIGPR